ncbi:hypothetical protein ACHAPJ_010626 [Fusarium lateritium]
MPTGVEEITGLALGGVSLLAGFAGAVEGYKLLHDIVAKDNGLRSVAAEWHVESVLFAQWGESVRVEEGDACLLHQESALVRGAIALVIAEVQTLQQKMTPKLRKYGIENVKLPSVQGPSEEAFKNGSIWVANIRTEFDKIKQVCRVKWAVQDEKDMQRIVEGLHRSNENLRNLIRPTEANLLREQTVLLETIKASQEDQLSLLEVQRQIISNPDSLVAILHRTRELQAIKPEELARQAILLTAAQISFGPTSASPANLQIGTHEPQDGLPPSIFMEWEVIKAGEAAKDELVERIKALGALLCLANASQYRRPACIGTFDDAQYEEDTKGGRRIAFVYELPSSPPVLPTTLSSLLQEAKTSKARPPLGERFTLAYRLASAVYMFHTSNWLHKGLRADRVLFATSSDITYPWITGFQYSRPVTDISLEARPTGDPRMDFYYHPNVGVGWTKFMDIYSLGILLWEIANWRPAYESRFRGMNLKDIQNCLLNDLHGSTGDMWNGLVGKVYMDVVRCCLGGDFGVISGQGEQEAKVLGTVFFQKVLRELERCKA